MAQILGDSTTNFTFFYLFFFFSFFFVLQGSNSFKFLSCCISMTSTATPREPRYNLFLDILSPAFQSSEILLRVAILQWMSDHVSMDVGEVEIGGELQ